MPEDKLIALKIVITACFAVIMLTVPLPAQQASQPQNPARYETEDRSQWQMPETVVDSLELKPGQTVADIGSASGFFARRFSPKVGPEGRVLAVDIDAEALAYLARLAANQGLANLDTLQALADNPRLPEAGVDLIFMCNTLHHIPDRVAYLTRLKKALRPGGRVAIVDFFKKELPVGPAELAHKLSQAEAKESFTEAGYRIDREFTFLPYQYFFSARPE